MSLSLFGRLLRSNPFENPQVPLTAENVEWFLETLGGGRSDANEIVTPMTAMQTATVVSCVRILAEQVGTAPLYLFELTESGQKLASDQPLFSLLELAPNEDMHAMTFRFALTAQALLWGAGYAEVIRNGGGLPVGLWPRAAWATRPIRVNGRLKFETTDNAEGQRKVIDAENMIYLPYISLDGQTGLSPIALARQAFGTSLAMDRFGARFFGAYAMPKLAIQTDKQMKPEDKNRARLDWEAMQSGSNQHRVAILDAGMKITTLSIPPEDAQFLESRKYTKSEICGMYGIPPHFLAQMDGAIKANVEQQGIEMLQYTLGPLFKRWTIEIRRKLLPRAGRNTGRFTVRFDTRDLIRPDAASRQSFYQSGVQNGYLVQDEIREMEQLNAYEGKIGSTPAIQLNMQPLSALLTAPAPLPDPLSRQEAEQNSLRNRMFRQYLPLFRQGFERFLAGSERDFQAMKACLGPVLTAIGDDLRGGAIPSVETARTIEHILQHQVTVLSPYEGRLPAERDLLYGADLQTAITFLLRSAAADQMTAKNKEVK